MILFYRLSDSALNITPAFADGALVIKCPVLYAFSKDVSSSALEIAVPVDFELLKDLLF